MVVGACAAGKHRSMTFIVAVHAIFRVLQKALSQTTIGFSLASTAFYLVKDSLPRVMHECYLTRDRRVTTHHARCVNRRPPWIVQDMCASLTTFIRTHALDNHVFFLHATDGWMPSEAAGLSWSSLRSLFVSWLEYARVPQCAALRSGVLDALFSHGNYDGTLQQIMQYVCWSFPCKCSLETWDDVEHDIDALYTRLRDAGLISVLGITAGTKAHASSNKRSTTVAFGVHAEEKPIEARGTWIRLLRIDANSGCLVSTSEELLSHQEIENLQFKIPSGHNCKMAALVYSDHSDTGLASKEFCSAPLSAECDCLEQELANDARSCLLQVKNVHPWARAQGFMLLHMMHTLFLDWPYDFCVSVSFLRLLPSVLATTGSIAHDPWMDLYHFCAYLFHCKHLDRNSWQNLFPDFFIHSPESLEYWNYVHECFGELSGCQFFLDYLMPDVGPGTSDYKFWLAHYRQSCPYKDFPADLPDPRYMHTHDTISYFKEVRATPKILPPFSDTMPDAESLWGDTGDVRLTNSGNLVTQANCALRVDVLLNDDVLLSDIVGANFMTYIESGLSNGGIHNVPSWSEWKQIRYQCLGEQFLSRVRPGNVLHPHLRPHFEFHAGRLLHKLYSRGHAHTIPLKTFLRALGQVLC